MAGDRTWYDDDDALAEELAVALREDTEQGPDRVAMLMVGYDIVMADTLEADLIHDSAIDEVAAVRSTTEARMLTYRALDGDLEIEVEIVDGSVIGHVEPCNGGTVRLEQPAIDRAPVVEVEADEHGSFEFVLRSAATFRVRYVDATGRSVATPWLDGPHPARS
jgi:hypothetical protein